MTSRCWPSTQGKISSVTLRGEKGQSYQFRGPLPVQTWKNSLQPWPPQCRSAIPHQCVMRSTWKMTEAVSQKVTEMSSSLWLEMSRLSTRPLRQKSNVVKSIGPGVGKTWYHQVPTLPLARWIAFLSRSSLTYKMKIVIILTLEN